MPKTLLRHGGLRVQNSVPGGADRVLVTSLWGDLVHHVRKSGATLTRILLNMLNPWNHS
jgi:hypothetical protein